MQKIPFDPSLFKNFTFSPILDGETYFCTIEWLSVTQRWWLELKDSSQTVVCYQPLIASSNCKDFQLCAALNFKTNFIYRANSKCFEIGGIKRDNCPDWIQEWDRNITFTKTKITVQKITLGGVGEFSFTGTNLETAIDDITTVAVNTATPAIPTEIKVSKVDSAVTITESALPTGFRLLSVNCAEGTLSGNTLTIPAENVVYNKTINCVFTNVKEATITIQKNATGAGTFSFSQSNLESDISDIVVTNADTDTPASPVEIIVSEFNTDIVITESLHQYYDLTSVTCTDLNSAITGNTGNIGTLNGQTFTIPAENVVPGAKFQCVFFNINNTVPMPNLTITAQPVNKLYFFGQQPGNLGANWYPVSQVLLPPGV